jgi:AbrB family looped-hinge helix DNA binding protein
MKIHNKGQVVIPAEIRRRFGLDIGDEVDVSIDDKGIHLYPVPPSGIQLKGSLREEYLRYGFPSEEEIAAALEAGLSGTTKRTPE